MDKQDKIILEPGIYSDISNEDYHNKIDGVSNSWLGEFKYCPAKAKLKRTSEADHFVFGRAFHTLTLEGAVAFNKEFAVSPDPPCPADRKPKGWRNTTEYKTIITRFKGQNLDKPIISLSHYKDLKGMDASLKSHPLAKKFLENGIPEQTVIWIDEDTGLRCKCRPDWIPAGDNDTLVDAKSTKNASHHSFKRSMWDYGYDRQGAFYLDGYNAATGSEFDAFAFAAVEKTAPYRTGTYILGEETPSNAREEYKKLLHQVKHCMETGYWPAYSPDWQEQVEL
ncbi:PD-(D/E)XK nuclease-like domain-containing protein [Candidatus Pacearchaeota archaeon]|nr:PD-(D/E)XK nuclease-like domain-containing protein [Candidatus Pacearchaeota archaeon]